VISQFSVKIKKQQINDYSLEGTANGEPLDLARHGYKVEIKAVTYHEMKITQEKGTVTVRFLLDL
jgi:SHS2 domain-containing protein